METDEITSLWGKGHTIKKRVLITAGVCPTVKVNSRLPLSAKVETAKANADYLIMTKFGKQLTND